MLQNSFWQCKFEGLLRYTPFPKSISYRNNIIKIFIHDMIHAMITITFFMFFK